MLMKTPAKSLPPSLESLATILRDQSLWPRGFEWDFRCHGSCALGLASRIWPESYIMVYFEDGYPSYYKIFFSKGIEWKGWVPVGYNRECVTPERVADRIDRVLAQKEKILV